MVFILTKQYFRECGACNKVQTLAFAWAGAPSCYFEMLYKLQKQIFKTVVPLLTASLETLAHHRNVATFSIAFTLVDVHLNWMNWFHFFILVAGLLFILIGSMIFLSPFLDVIRMSISTVFYLAQLHFGISRKRNAFLWSNI